MGLSELFVSLNVPHIYRSKSNLPLISRLYDVLSLVYQQQNTTAQDIQKVLVCKSVTLIVTMYLTQNVAGESAVSLTTNLCFTIGIRVTAGQGIHYTHILK